MSPGGKAFMSNISDRRRAATSHQPSAVEISTNRTREWARVPEAWRTLIIRVDAREDLVALFVQNYRFRGRTIDFTPTGVPERIVQEVMWWLWLCGREGIRKIEPSTLKWCSRTLTTAVAGFRRDHGRDPDSITDMEVGALLRVALKGFEQRNGRLPSTYSRRNITYLVESMHLYLSVRCTDKSWWQHDIWDLRADARIPVREHEPFHDHNVVLSDIERPGDKVSPAVPPPPGEKARLGLARYRKHRSAAKRHDIEKAVRALRKAGAPISVAAVAEKANVSRNTIYKHKDILATIDQYRTHPVNTNESSPSPRESSVVAALRRKLAATQAENAALKAAVAERDTTIAILYGQLDQRQ